MQSLRERNYESILSPQEAEAQLENEEARVLRAQLELTQLKQEIERRLNEKDEETESMRKNHQRQLEALQHSLDAEVKAKNDQVKQRKMVEGQVDDMQSSIDDLGKVSSHDKYGVTYSIILNEAEIK